MNRSAALRCGTLLHHNFLGQRSAALRGSGEQIASLGGSWTLSRSAGFGPRPNSFTHRRLVCLLTSLSKPGASHGNQNRLSLRREVQVRRGAGERPDAAPGGLSGVRCGRHDASQPTHSTGRSLRPSSAAARGPAGSSCASGDPSCGPASPAAATPGGRDASAAASARDENGWRGPASASAGRPRGGGGKQCCAPAFVDFRAASR